jgi:CHASE2 domain-containing sensor protein
MVEAIRSAYLAAERRKWLAREIPRRLSLTAVLALALGLLSLPLLNSQRAQDLERHTADARFALQPLHAPDPRILIITIDDASLAADQTLLSDKADELGVQLERVFDAGADGIAIDFLLPYSWSRSESFSRFVLSSASVLTLASFSSPSGETVGTNCLAGLTASALGPDLFRSLFGFVNLDEDSDGIARRARFFYSDSSGGRWDTWAIRAARSIVAPTHRVEASGARRGSFWIDYSADWQKMERISWKDLSRYLESNRSVFRHRLVLVGGDYVASGDDYHRVPARVGSPGAVSGVMLEALIVDTILADFPIRETGEPTRHFAVILLCAAALAGALCIPRLSLFAILFTSVNVLYLLAAFLLFRWSSLILSMAGPLVMGLVALGISLILRSILSAFPSPD